MAEPETVKPGELNTPQPTEAEVAVGLAGSDEGVRAPAEGPEPKVNGEASPEAAKTTEGQPTPDKDEALARLNTLLGKDYPSWEEAAKSYKELEKQFAAFREAGVSPEDALTQLQESAKTSTPEVAEAPDELEFLSSLADNPRQTIRSEAREESIAIFTAAMAGWSMWQDLLQKYPEASEFEMQMSRVFDAIPPAERKKFMEQPDVMERVYQQANPRWKSVADDRVAKADAEKADAQRREGFVERGSGGVPKSPDADQQVRDEILAAGARTPVGPRG